MHHIMMAHLKQKMRGQVQECQSSPAILQCNGSISSMTGTDNICALRFGKWLFSDIVVVVSSLAAKNRGQIWSHATEKQHETNRPKAGEPRRPG